MPPAKTQGLEMEHCKRRSGRGHLERGGEGEAVAAASSERQSCGSGLWIWGLEQGSGSRLLDQGCG